MKAAIALMLALLLAGCAAGRTPRVVRQRLKEASKMLAAGRDVPAGRQLDAAIEASPGRFDTYKEVVGLLLAYGRFREAGEYAAFVLENAASKRYLGRGLTKDERLTILALLAESRYRAGDISAAADVYERAVALAPTDPTVLNNLGYYYAEAGRELPRALALTKRAVALAPGRGIFVDSLGWTYYKLGRYEEAERDLRLAVQLEPDEAEIRYHLGALYARWGEVTRARIELSKAVALDPGHYLALAELKRLERGPQKEVLHKV